MPLNPLDKEIDSSLTGVDAAKKIKVSVPLPEMP
jgi:hypothetical protein